MRGVWKYRPDRWSIIRTFFTKHAQICEGKRDQIEGREKWSNLTLQWGWIKIEEDKAPSRDAWGR